MFHGAAGAEAALCSLPCTPCCSRALEPWHRHWELAVPPVGTRAEPCPAPGLLLHFPLDLGPILPARHALVSEPCSVPSHCWG